MLLTSKMARAWPEEVTQALAIYMLENGVEEKDIEHVVHCCCGIARVNFHLVHYDDSFCTAILRHSLDAVYHADDTNLKYLRQYCFFVKYWLP